jgi:hypothetical protein
MRTIAADNSDRPRAGSHPSRRAFVAGVATTGAVGAVIAAIGSSPGQGAMPDDPPALDSIRWRLEARREEQFFNDSSVLPFFRFFSAGNTPSNGRVPYLKATQNLWVGLRLKNLLDFPVQPMILSYKTGPLVMPGTQRDWFFRMPPVGTWMLTEATLGVAAGPLGFGGAVVSTGPRLSSTGQTGQTSPYEGPYDKEYFLLFQDADDRWNLAFDNGDEPDISQYHPNYHTINGLTFPATADDPATRISCQLHDKVLIRVGNLGHARTSLHLHGYHLKIIRKNNLGESILPEKDTFEVAQNTTLETVLNVSQVGEYPIHPHDITKVTDNGYYPGGQLTMIDAIDAP